MIQDLIQNWTKYAAHIVQYPNKHLLKRQLQAASFLQWKEEDMNEFSDGDEENSSGEDVKQCFNEVEFMNEFCARLMQVMDEGIMQSIDQLSEELEREQHRKHLHEEKAKPLPKTAHKSACKVASEHVQTHTTWPDCSMCPPWCNEAPEHHQHPLQMRQAIKDNQSDALHHTSNIATTTWPLHPLHMSPGPGGDEHVPLIGCTSTHRDHQVPNTVHKLCELCSCHEVASYSL